jgi:hypothetical protein
MKYMAIAALVIAWTPQRALADAYDLYYVRCLQAAAMVEASPNADGSAKDPNDHSSMLNPSNPELYRFCRYRAHEQAEGGK